MVGFLSIRPRMLGELVLTQSRKKLMEKARKVLIMPVGAEELIAFVGSSHLW